MANPLSKLGGLFSFKKLFKKDESVLGIDIGSSAIKVVQLRAEKGRAVLETYGEIALGPYAGLSVGQAASLSVDQTVEALHDLFREANVTSTKAAVSIALKSSLLKVIDLPSYREQQINRMIPLEARKHIPVPISEVNLDWWVLPKRHTSDVPDDQRDDSNHADEKTSVLLVAIHKSAVKRYQDIATKAGLKLGTLEIETFSLIRSVFTHDIRAVAILDIGASISKLSIVDYGVVRVSHVINKGAQDVTVALSKALSIPFAEAEKRKRAEGLAAYQPAKSAMSNIESGTSTVPTSSMLDYLFYEAKRVILEYQRNSKRLVDTVFLTGGGALLLGLHEIAAQSFDANVVLGDPFAKVQSPTLLSGVLAEAGPEFAVAIGLAIHQLGEV